MSHYPLTVYLLKPIQLLNTYHWRCISHAPFLLSLEVSFFSEREPQMWASVLSDVYKPVESFLSISPVLHQDFILDIKHDTKPLRKEGLKSEDVRGDYMPVWSLGIWPGRSDFTFHMTSTKKFHSEDRASETTSVDFISHHSGLVRDHILHRLYYSFKPSAHSKEQRTALSSCIFSWVYHRH